MRLKNTDDSAGIFSVSQRSQSSFAFGWMVAIIVEDSDICASICHACAQILHAPLHASEIFKCVLDRGSRCSQPSRQDRSGGGIERVVFSRKSSTPRKHFFVSIPNACRICRWFIFHFVISSWRPAKCVDSALQSACNRSSMGAFVTDQQLPANFCSRQISSEDTKGLHDLVERSIHIKMIFFDIIDQRHRRLMRMKRAVEFARFGDENPRRSSKETAWDYFTSSSRPATIQLRTVRADDHRWIESSFDQQMRQQCSRRALAVGPCD